MDACDFECGALADYGWDGEWDAMLCWRCHTAQLLMMWMLRYSASRRYPA